MSRFLEAIIFMTQARLVPCGYTGAPECEMCHFFIFARDIITYALEIIVPLAALLIIVGGVLIMAAGGHANLAVRGKKLIRIAVIGMIGALGGWLIINSVIVFVVNPDTFPLPWHAWKMPCPIVEIDLAEASESSYIVLTDALLPGISPGDMLRFSFTYTNISSERLSNLVITTDYDQVHTISTRNISGGGISDGNKITWEVGELAPNELVTLTYDFVLSNDFSDMVTQQEVGSFFTLDDIKIDYFRDKIIVASDQTVSQTAHKILDLTLPIGLFTERIYHLIGDFDNNDRASVGDEFKYDIEYVNLTSFDLNNVTIVSDYDQNHINIGDILGGGVDNGDKIVWNLGTLLAGQPPPDNPGCLGYNFTVFSTSANFISNIFTTEFDERRVEANDDKVFIELPSF